MTNNSTKMPIEVLYDGYEEYVTVYAEYELPITDTDIETLLKVHGRYLPDLDLVNVDDDAETLKLYDFCEKVLTEQQARKIRSKVTTYAESIRSKWSNE